MRIDQEYVEEKVETYSVAIESLRQHESESDTANSKALRERLADRLDKECQRWLNKHGDAVEYRAPEDIY